MAAASTVAIGEALRVLFLPTSTSEDRKRADRILNDFQRTPEAWQLADELLRAAQQDQQWTQHCRMFASQVRPVTSRATLAAPTLGALPLPRLRTAVTPAPIR